MKIIADQIVRTIEVVLMRLKKSKVNILVFFFYFLSTIFFLKPLVFNAKTRLPDLGDSIHNIWIMGFNARKILQLKFNFFETNIFYPEKAAGTFAEANIAQSIIFIPFYLLDQFVFGYNFQIFLSFLLSAYFVYLIAFFFSKNVLSSCLAGFIFGFFPYRYAHLPHLQQISTQWFLLAFYLYIKYLDSPSFLSGTLSALSFLFQVVSWGYNTIYLYILVFLYFLWIIVNSSRKKRARLFKQNFYLFSPILIIVIPFYLPYLKSYLNGYFRAMAGLESYGNDLLLYFSSSPISKAYGKFSLRFQGIRPDWVISGVFPGFLVYILLFLSIFTIKKFRQKISFLLDYSNKEKLFFVLFLILSFFLSLGPSIKIAGIKLIPNLVSRLSEFLIFGKSIRYVPNYIILFMFSLSVIISLGIPCFLKRIKSRALSILFALFVIVILALEFHCKINTVNFSYSGSKISRSYQELSRIKDEFAIFEIPFISRIALQDPYFLMQFKYMYFSIYHGKKLVNGISGFFPDFFSQLVILYGKGKMGKLVTELKKSGVKYILFHKESFKTRREAEKFFSAVMKTGHVEVNRDFGNDVLLNIK
mgnify:CR=1 FL=1